MFDLKQLEKAVEIQGRSYAFLKWMQKGLRLHSRQGTWSHIDLDVSDAAAEWIRRHLTGIPEDAQPAWDDIPVFARFLSSYLKTSYRIVRARISRCGCYCDWCSYMGSALHPRQPSKKAAASAEALKRGYVRLVSEELKLPYLESDFEAILGDASLAPHISWCTYGQEMLRRMHFSSQGEGVLVLWREIAWNAEGRVPDGFKLEAQRFLSAEEAVIEGLKKALPLN